MVWVGNKKALTKIEYHRQKSVSWIVAQYNCRLDLFLSFFFFLMKFVKSWRAAWQLHSLFCTPLCLYRFSVYDRWVRIKFLHVFAEVKRLQSRPNKRKSVRFGSAIAYTIIPPYKHLLSSKFQFTELLFFNSINF